MYGVYTQYKTGGHFVSGRLMRGHARNTAEHAHMHGGRAGGRMWAALVVYAGLVAVASAQGNVSNDTDTTQAPTVAQFHTWELVVIVVDGVALALLFAMAGAVCLAVVHWRRKQRVRLLRVGQFGDDEVCTDHGRTGVSSPILYKDIVITELLGRGTFTLVHRAHLGYQEVVIKTLKDNHSELGRSELVTEIERYRMSQQRDPSGHPNILQFYGGSSVSSPLFLCIELMPCGTVDQFLVALQKGPIPNWYIEFASSTLEGSYTAYVAGSLMYIILQVCRGMAFLSHFGITHRSLSTRAVFLTADLQAKVGSFGVPLEGHYYMVTDRAHYLEDMAPENMQGKRFSVKSDVWSFGILVYKVCTLGAPPFPDISPSDIYHEIGAGRRPNMLGCCSSDMYFLLQRCWQHSPIDRPFFGSLQNDFEQMIDDPSKHVNLQLMEEGAPGSLDVQGVAHLFRPPQHLLDGTAHSGRRTPLLQEWRRQSAPQPSVELPSVDQMDGSLLEPRPSPDGKDKSSGKRSRGVRRCLPTLQDTRAAMEPTHIYLPPLNESQLGSGDEQGDNEELDISVLVGGARMPLTHAASNLSIYSMDGDEEKATPYTELTDST